MIELGREISDELKLLEAEMKEKARAAPLLGRHYENYAINGHLVRCEQNRRVVKGHLTWVTTWYFNKSRVGFNNLLARLSK